MPTERQSQGCTCPKYLALLAENARLKEQFDHLQRENARYRRELGRLRKTMLEKPFGLSTPSAKQPVKASTPPPPDEAELRRRKGGARKGHKGHGWKKRVPDEEVELPAPERCPCCGGELVDPPFAPEETREVVSAPPAKARVRRYRVHVKYCPRCAKPVRPRINGVLPGCRHDNSLLARAAVDTYFHGIPAGTVARRLGVDKGTLLQAFVRVAKKLEAAVGRLLETIRSSPLAQGDESPWRTDGNNGYCWVFIAGNAIVYRCGVSRASSVAKDALGEDYRGLFLSDRYAGYGFIACRAYCLEHLRRDALQLAEDDTGSAECAAYAAQIVPLLSEIMKLRRLHGHDPGAYRAAALDAARRLWRIVTAPSADEAVQQHKNLFLDFRLRPWQWLAGPQVPADNNRSEREIRPVAIARKVSHGSQSERGAKTRGTFMSILHTLAACRADPGERLERALDTLAGNPGADLFDALFGGLDLAIPVLPNGPLTVLPPAVLA